MASSARIDELKKKFDDNPRRYFAPLANEYRKAGDLEQAIAICRQHLADQPGNMSGHIVYGQALFDARQFDDAKVVFEAALALDPENLIALRHLGDIARDSGDFVAGRQWYQRVLDADPRNEDIAAQLQLVDEAMAQAASRVPDTIVTLSATPVLTPAEPKRVDDEAARADVGEAATLQIRAVPDPRFAAPPPAAPEPEPAPSLDEADVAVPRMSLMGLDLDSMAKLADTEETPAPAAGGFETSTTFDRARFDSDVEVENNPLAGIDGVPERDESSAGSLLAPPPDSGFELNTAFTPTYDDEPRAEQLPPELQMPDGVTTPPVDLELPEPVFEATGLWDTAAERAAAAAPAPPPPPAVPAPDASSLPMIELEELPLPAPIELAAVTAAPTESAVFVTETMAELYLNQGLPDQALDVYRQLLARRPGDALLASKITHLEAAVRATPAASVAAIEAADAVPTVVPSVAAAAARAGSAPSGVSTRAFFGALARWRAGAGGAPADGGTLAAPVSTASVVDGATTAVAVSGPWTTGAPFDLGLFAGSRVGDADEQAARFLAALYPEPIAATAHDGPLPAATAPAPAPAPEEAAPMPGQPAHAASTELSLDQVFPEPAAARPSRRTSSSFAFDQFFAEAAPAPPARTSKLTPAVPTAAVQTPEEIEQFQTWLQGLKKK